MMYTICMELYQKIEELKSLIENDERVIKLKEAEIKMNNSEEVQLLSYKKDLAASDYSDILNHFSRESETSKKYQKVLYENKKKLDEHPLVKEYMYWYIKVRDLYNEINEILFSHLEEDLSPKGK